MPRRARLTTYLTVADILRLQGLPVVRREKKRLTRLLLARERSTESGFLVRASDSPNAAILVTIASLRQHMPELFDRREEAVDFLKEAISELRQAEIESRQRDKALAARIRGHADRLSALEQWPKVAHGGPSSGQG